MQYVYNSFVYLAMLALKIVAFFNANIKEFVLGRQDVFQKINAKITKNDLVVWIHAASLGEFEQGRPVIEALKEQYPKHKIVLTFFSPSGYTVRKNYELADLVCYLPMDTLKNAARFVKALQPCLVIFIKYEFWPNYLHQLKKHHVPTFLISGIFRESQIFFKPYGFWMRKSLGAFSHFFVQDEVSSHLLKSIRIDEVTIAGDTRFDRVHKLLEANPKLDFIQDFVGDAYVLVAGSTWPEDELQLVDYINNHAKENEKFIIAPHNIKQDDIQKLKASIHKKTILFTQKRGVNLADFQVFIVDTIGILSKIYACAHVTYIGGGYTKSGVHNTLEAATYGLPIVIGPNYKKFKEVQDLVALQGCQSVNNADDLIAFLKLMRDDPSKRHQKATLTNQYVKDNLGATQKIMLALQKSM